MAEPYTIKMPQLSDTMTEGVVVSWEKKPGDAVSRGDIVAQVETDKAIMDVEVFREGYLSGPRAPVDSTAAVGDPIAYIVASQEEVVTGEADVPPAASAGPRGGAEQDDSEAPAEPVANTGAEAPSAPDSTTYTIKMPQLSDTMTEGVVVSWEKGPGDAVSRGDVVAQVETDKAIMDVEVFREGYLSGPLAPVDSTVPVGDPMGFLVADADQALSTEQAGGGAPRKGTAQEKPAAARQAPAPSAKPAAAGGQDVTPAPRPESGYASPYARKLAAIHGVDLTGLKGSGPQGEIVAADVERAAPAAGRAGPVQAQPEIQVPGEGRPMNSMEKAVAQNMTAALTMPTFNVTLHAWPEVLTRAAKAAGVSVTVAIAKACAEAIAEHPKMNAAYQPVDKLVERDNVDIGMAVAAKGGGLVVPVLRNCDATSTAELNEQWQDLVARAREKRLKPEEYANPTFMVSNMGMLGVDWFDAIPTPGMAAILAIATTNEKGMPLTITADHRVVNGAEVAQFLITLKEKIEQPEAWLGGGGPMIPEGDWDYDVVVIGGGPGGEDAARDLAGHGLKVALVNDSPYPGGECLWRGCIPSKTWRAAADRLKDRAHDGRLGISDTDMGKLDWSKLEATRREVLESRGQMALKADKGVRIEVIQGFARFEDDHRLFVDQSGNSDDPHQRAVPGQGKEGRSLSFGCAIIATGAPPFVPPIPGAREGLADHSVLTSDTVWGLKEPPARLVVVGAGAIGAEMAQIFHDFGGEVTLLEAQERILAEVEPEVAKNLAGILAEQPRLTVQTGAQVEKIEGKPGNVTVQYVDAEGKQHSVACDRVIMATGKRPDLAPLALDKAGLQAEEGVIPVNAQMRTAVGHIYAVGDVNGGLMLAHTAGAQGRVAAQTIVGERAAYDQALDCGVIFTRPQAAFVGLSQEQAKATGYDPAEVKVPMNIDAKAMITGETEGLIKLVADKASERIVGVHLLADHADTLIGEAVMMVSGRMTLSQVGEAIHPHPTQTEIFGDLARRLLSRLRRSRKKAGSAQTSKA